MSTAASATCFCCAAVSGGWPSAICGQNAKPFTRPCSCIEANSGILGLQAAIGGGGADPHGEAFFAVAHARDHLLRAFGRVDAGGDRDARQVDEIAVVQQAQLLLHQFQQLRAQRAVAAVGQVEPLRRCAPTAAAGSARTALPCWGSGCTRCAWTRRRWRRCDPCWWPRNRTGGTRPRRRRGSPRACGRSGGRGRAGWTWRKFTPGSLLSEKRKLHCVVYFSEASPMNRRPGLPAPAFRLVRRGALLLGVLHRERLPAFRRQDQSPRRRLSRLAAGRRRPLPQSGAQARRWRGQDAGPHLERPAEQARRHRADGAVAGRHAHPRRSSRPRRIAACSGSGIRRC